MLISIDIGNFENIKRKIWKKDRKYCFQYFDKCITKRKKEREHYNN